ncbi:MAG TPA: YegS/Rv2252/BmrU family lipid kinase [Methanospirillum sp.]|uniref:diacylglycerol/lipid kinase family protein n=1 Tax=Methanospirillum sp. TaxID=45200 RepID=UPI002C487389|nr:YegS/Rv2252/BmrU family lipid kinase [Methanospirillum sp.]HOJ96543.1 YegS/Rv2252/BmrU family lipid kinase [Methanospirillum sp.]HOL41595.1 YegS/Rv2252/BmrU family lipid kinase [Methanospirillum sp.]
MKNKHELEQIIRKNPQAVLIVNTHSRNGERLFFKALDLLQLHGIEVIAAYPVRKPERIRSVVSEVISQKNPLIIIGGGDGTFNTIIDLFVHQDTVLGILPLGTANNFARSMGIPMSVHRAIEVIATGKVVDIDLGMINSQYFINIATIGFSHNVVSATPRKLKRYLGMISYLLCETQYLISQELFRCIITTDGREETIHTRQLIIANGSFYGARKITPDAHIDNDTLIIFAMDSESRWQGLKFWIGFFLGRHLTFPQSRIYKVKEATIETIPRKYVIMGGEKTTQTPAHLSIDNEAIQVIAPQFFQDHDEEGCLQAGYPNESFQKGSCSWKVSGQQPAGGSTF